MLIGATATWCAMFCWYPWKACLFLNRNRGGVDEGFRGEVKRREWEKRRKEKLYLGCKINNLFFLKKKWSPYSSWIPCHKEGVRACHLKHLRKVWRFLSVKNDHLREIYCGICTWSHPDEQRFCSWDMPEIPSLPSHYLYNLNEITFSIMPPPPWRSLQGRDLYCWLCVVPALWVSQHPLYDCWEKCL